MRKTTRSICVFLAILTLILSVNFVTAFAVDKGDINADGSVSVSDAMLLFNYVAGKESFTDEQKKIADVNADGDVNIADAMKLYNIILGKDTAVEENPSEKEGNFVITTYGWGHDIGMSQNGANLYAKKEEMKYDEILSHYYPGTKLVKSDKNAPTTVKYGGKSYSMRDYLAGALYAEMGPSFATEALKAQCIAIYTFGKYYSNFGIDFNSGHHAMKLNVKDAEKSSVIYKIVDEVMGQYLTYGGNVAFTPYSATSCGTTAACKDIWVQDLPYLTRVESKYDYTVDGYKKTKTISEDEMKYKLESYYGIKLSDNPEKWLKIISHDKAVSDKIGHVLEISIDGQKTVKGARIYEKLGLRSPCYTIEYV